MKNNILSAKSAQVVSVSNVVENAKSMESHAQTGPTLSEIYEDNCKKKGATATAEVTYVSLNKAIKMINVALEKDGKAINAPVLKGELSSTGHDKFCIDCLDFMYGTHTLLCAPKAGESDFVLIHARKDAEGRNTYRVQDLIKCFEAKYASIFEAQNAAKKAEAEAKKAQKAAERAAKNAEKEEHLQAAKAKLDAIIKKSYKNVLSDKEYEIIASALSKANVG